MIIRCEKCSAAYNFDDSHVKPNGSNVRCVKCSHVFKVYRAREKYSKTLMKKTPGTLKKKDEDILQPSAPKDKRKKPEKTRITKTGKKYTPFKRKLIYFAAILICFIGVIIIPIEACQPWQKLFQLINNSKNLIGGVESAFNAGDLERMNKFAMGTIDGAGNIFIADDKNSYYFYLSFNMLIADGKILPKDELEKMNIPGFEGSRLTKQSLDILTDKGVPKELAVKLKDLIIQDDTSKDNLENALEALGILTDKRDVTSKKELVNTLEVTIGENQAIKYKSLILEHAEFEKPEIRFDEQSLDILTDKGLPKELVAKLKDLIIQDSFANALENAIGKDQAVKYNSLILKHIEFTKKGSRLTKQSLDILMDKGVPKEIVTKLKDLIIQDELANALEDTIGKNQTVEYYKTMILRHAEFKKIFDYEKLDETKYYWKMRFADDPGIFEIFRKYKHILMKAYENAEDIGTVYIMIDTGDKKGFFENNIAYVLDGYNWRDEIATYVGEPYEITDNEFWRKLALNDREGYGTNPVFDSANWYLPRFDKDEYGSWFSVWLTKKTSGVYNVFTIDFDASSVNQLMVKVGAAVISVIIFLAIMVAVIARWLSKMVTRPITELTKGAGEVATGNYDYQVPILKKDEFGELTEQFNKMTLGQKERLNLMETLEKFLSKELAEMAAENGIMLGGQKSDCTVMFTDFAGFSTITQKMTAYESVEVLNLYFDAMIPIIKNNGGFPDKYIGDAIVAMFGAPVPVEDHAERAVSCAIKMQQKMREINDKRRKQVCFTINDQSLVYLQSKGVSDDFVKKLENIKNQTLLEYLKFQGVSDDIIGKLAAIKQKEYIGKGEFLKGEFLDIVLNQICDEQHIENYKPLLLKYAEKQKRAVFEMRVGLNSGEVIAGAIGCDAKLEYTSIGETTNLANRMEASCEVGHVAIAKETFMRIKHIFFKGVNISATPDIVAVKGMGDVPVFRVYVNNLKIKKDMNMKNDIKKFYVYEEVNHELRDSPDNVPGVTFTSIAKYL